MSILELKDVCYSYSAEKPVLRGMNCTFECGTLYALVGKSGAGKSTLLSLMAGLDLPDSGQVLFEGTPTGDMDLDEYRRRKAAVIYQDFALFPLLTALENIEYPMELCRVEAQEAERQARELARRVSLPDELLDRYGDVPKPVTALLHVAMLRAAAMETGITDITQKGRQLLFSFDTRIDPAALLAVCTMAGYRNRLQLSAGTEPRLTLFLQPNEDALDAAGGLVEKLRLQQNEIQGRKSQEGGTEHEE